MQNRVSIPDEDDERRQFPFLYRKGRRVMVRGEMRTRLDLDFSVGLE